MAAIKNQLCVEETHINHAVAVTPSCEMLRGTAFGVILDPESIINASDVHSSELAIAHHEDRPM